MICLHSAIVHMHLHASKKKHFKDDTITITKIEKIIVAKIKKNIFILPHSCLRLFWHGRN